MPYERAREPNDLAGFFIERANAGDLDGLVALFEPDVLVAAPGGDDVTGHQAIRAKYAACWPGRRGSASATSSLP